MTLLLASVHLCGHGTVSLCWGHWGAFKWPLKILACVLSGLYVFVVSFMYYL